VRIGSKPVMAEEAEEELPPPTLPANLPLEERGFPDVETAEKAGHQVCCVLHYVSRFIDLERLDGVTIAFDYDDTLAQLDRGRSDLRPLSRTQTDQLSGVAMTPAVTRDGIVKSHIVLNASYMTGLDDPEGSDPWWLAVSLIAHEAGHVEEQTYRDRAFPGTILQQQYDTRLAELLAPAADVVWEEYAACRLSAIFCQSQVAAYIDGLQNVLQAARPTANEAIKRYRLHGALMQVVGEACPPLVEPLRLLAYLLGHLDGVGQDFAELQDVRTELTRTGYLGFATRLQQVLGALWEKRGAWTSRVEFEPLETIVRDVLSDGGLVACARPDGSLYVDVPFSPDTIPD
jgi:hypothetical protein